MTYKDSLLWRYATKHFDPSKKISDADLQEILDTLRFSPSSYGLQPWHFLVITNDELRATLRPHSWDQPQITDCSHLIVLCARTDMDEEYIQKYTENIAAERGVAVETLDEYKQMMINGVLGKSPEVRQAWMQKQVYIALGFLMHACMMKKIDCCPMEGFSSEEYDSILGLTERGLTATVLLPVGYRTDDDAYAELQKVRWEEEDVVEHLE